MDNTCFPLGFLKNGQTAIVRGASGGKNMRQRLIEMGLVAGVKIRIIKNNPGGPLIIALNENRLAIGRGVSLKIMVEETG